VNSFARTTTNISPVRANRISTNYFYADVSFRHAFETHLFH